MAVHKGIARRQAAAYARKAGATFLADMASFFPRIDGKDIASMHSENRRKALEIKPSMFRRGVLKNSPKSGA